ncbi:MAG: hypothetical protein EBT44_02200 [Actinobacteria bacterium]|uniref:Rho termination factor-like N-terminal domain-containing protein n=1 Tax=Candidatus Fonsibacter lacus TaxID=2576439 RepID=A0A965GCM7_9PROT|nr:hypothetical protein [Candidatus Fonsibacter lacus]
MAGNKSASDNPWAEMARLNLPPKSSKASDDEKVNPQTNPNSNKAEVASAAAASTIAGGSAAADNSVETDYSVDELQEMSLKELQEIARENGIDPKNLSKEDLIDALTDDEVTLPTANSEDGEETLLEDEESLDTEEIDGEMSLEEALALLGEDAATEEDITEVEFEEVESEVLEGDVEVEVEGER